VTNLAQAQQLDAQDELAAYRGEFHIPTQANGQDVTYLCGHSLGLQPKDAARLIAEELADWQSLGVEGHFSGRRPWLPYHEQLTQRLAELAGASEQEVVAMNSLTVNLHLLMVSFYRPTNKRNCILIERDAFPSDRYAVASQIRWHGYDPEHALLQIAPRNGEGHLRQDDVLEYIEREGDRIALVMLPGVQYLTGQCFDIATISTHARRKGCAIGFDLAHAIGNVPLSLHDSGADFAVWCSYKYLNGGPGAIGGAFVHERHAHSFELPRFAGWWGHDKASRFAMPETFAPLAGAEGWQLSNPPILSMTPLLASLDLFSRAGMPRLRAKSLALADFLRTTIAAMSMQGVSILTPPDSDQHGCQISLSLSGDDSTVHRVRSRLATAHIMCDWREPNVLRVAPVPLYNTFVDVWRFVDTLAELLT